MATQPPQARAAAFADPKFDAANYKAYRLTYPPELYERIFQYHTQEGKSAGWERCVDLGCGTGQNTTTIAKHFKETYGVDASESMITVAKQDQVPGSKAESIIYITSVAESLPFLEDGSVDMVTSSEAAHWFNYEKLWPEVARVLKPNGTVAFWTYHGSQVSDPAIRQVIASLRAAAESSFGKGDPIAASLLKDIPHPGPPFDSTTFVFEAYAGNYYPAEMFPDPKPIMMKSFLTWEQLEGTMKSTSVWHRMLEKQTAEGNRNAEEKLEEIMQSFKDKVTLDGVMPEGVDLDSPMGLLMVKKAS